MHHKTKLTDFPSFEFEDDSGKYPKWIDELSAEELDWYSDYVDSMTETEYINSLAK
ncbi:hypothetical protein ACFP1C_13635 [Levilactobacillus fujinensis]|uniref:Uncharacterized protein n=2 Tax=Levilactobacillus fujinensis TaxID=2486024 RepID=A0ABW1TLJ4_9LACO